MRCGSRYDNSATKTEDTLLSRYLVSAAGRRSAERERGNSLMARRRAASRYSRKERRGTRSLSRVRTSKSCGETVEEAKEDEGRRTEEGGEGGEEGGGGRGKGGSEGRERDHKQLSTQH